MIFQIRCPHTRKILAVTNHGGADFSKFFCHTKIIAFIAASFLICINDRALTDIAFEPVS